jgi:hypothetical protein
MSKVIDVVDLNSVNHTVLALVDDYFSDYSENSEEPETTPKLCSAEIQSNIDSTENLPAKLESMNLRWSLIDPEYDV